MTSTASARRHAGFSLLEVMIALAVLTVGLLGMMHLQIIGIVSNNTGRKHTVATELADELISGIERLPFGDPLLLATGSTGPTAPTPFGRLVTGNTLSASASAARVWSDSTPVPGVRKTTEIGPEQAEYDRRWTVWGYAPSAGAIPIVKLVAVSVVYKERGMNIPREVVLYTQLNEPSSLTANITANQ
jgi:prepilin-type N-terminal cleavage/methylation domain-containing protein